jgi:hypothetical protein
MPAIVDLPDGRSVPLNAVRKRASRKRVMPRKQVPVTTRLSGDAPQTRAADTKKAEAFKKTADYRVAIRGAYNTRSIKDRHEALKAAALHGSPEGGIIARHHNNRAASDEMQKAVYGYLVRQRFGKGAQGRRLAHLGLKADAAATSTFGPHLRRYSGPASQMEELKAMADSTAVRAYGKDIQRVRKDDPAMLSPEKKAQLAAMLTKAQSGPGLKDRRSLFTKILSKAGGDTKSAGLFALHNLSRFGAAVASANLEGSKNSPLGLSGPGAVDTGKYLHGLKEGFLHPEEHMRDWNLNLERQGVTNKWVEEPLAFTYSVATDPLTYATLGAGGVAKNSALKAYEHAIESGMSEAAAVKAMRATWDAAPAAQKSSGIKVGIRGTPALLLSKGQKTHLESRPLGGGVSAMSKAVLRRAGVKNVKPLGLATTSIRNNLNKVAPSVRPAGWDKLDWELARRAARKGRAGEREAQRHAAYRLRAYRAATKGWTVAQHQAVIDAIEAGKTHELPDELRPVAEQIGREMQHAFSQRVERGLSQPLAPNSRVGVGAPPHTVEVHKVAYVREALKNAHKQADEIDKQYKSLSRELKKNPDGATSSELLGYGAKILAHTQHILELQQAYRLLGVHGAAFAAKRVLKEANARGEALIQKGQALVEQSVENMPKSELAAHIDELNQQHAKMIGQAQAIKDAEKDLKALGGKKAAKQYGKQLSAWSNAPVGFFPRVLDPDVLAETSAHGVGQKTKIYDPSRKITDRMANMPDDVRAKFEQRLPQAVAQYILSHRRNINLSVLNERIASLGHEVNPADINYSGKQELYEHAPTGLHPLFDKYGHIDPEAVDKAVSGGRKIVAVDRSMADAIRSLARGQRGLGDMPPELALAVARTPEQVNNQSTGVLSSYDNLQRRLKILQTSVNPAYHIVNLIGDSFNAAIGGARPGDFVAGKRPPQDRERTEACRPGVGPDQPARPTT